MSYLNKRIKGGLWVAFAGFLATLLGLVAKNIAEFNIQPPYDTIVLILCTASISQITKWLNKGDKN